MTNNNRWSMNYVFFSKCKQIKCKTTRLPKKNNEKNLKYVKIRIT